MFSFIPCNALSRQSVEVFSEGRQKPGLNMLQEENLETIIVYDWLYTNVRGLE